MDLFSNYLFLFLLLELYSYKKELELYTGVSLLSETRWLYSMSGWGDSKLSVIFQVIIATFLGKKMIYFFR